MQTIPCGICRPGLRVWRPPSAGGAPAPAWYQPIMDRLAAAGGGYLWLHETGIEEDVDQPVSAWADVTGTRSFVQPGVSSIRPTRKADRLRFDGVDDRLNEDTELPTWLARVSGPWTVGIGSPNTLSNNTDCWWGATTLGSSLNIVNYLTQNTLGRVGAATLFTPLIDTGPLSSWVAVAGGGSNQTLRRVSGAEATGSYGTQAEGLNAFTLGGRRTATPGVFLQGDLSWVIVCPVALSSADMAFIEGVLAANGYPT